MRQLVSQLQHAADRHRRASASTGGWKYGAANSAKPIILTLRNVGAKAGTEKRFQVLRIAPPAKPGDQQNIGKVIRSSWVVSANLSAVSAKPGAVMVITHGAASIPITVTIARARVSSPETYETNTRVASSPCLLYIRQGSAQTPVRRRLRQNTPQQVRQFEGDKRHRSPSRRQNTRHNRIAGKAQHARKHGHRTDCRQ